MKITTLYNAGTLKWMLWILNPFEFLCAMDTNHFPYLIRFGKQPISSQSSWHPSISSDINLSDNESPILHHYHINIIENHWYLSYYQTSIPKPSLIYILVTCKSWKSTTHYAPLLSHNWQHIAIAQGIDTCCFHFWTFYTKVGYTLSILSYRKYCW